MKRTRTPSDDIEFENLHGSELTIAEFQFLARMIARAVQRKMEREDLSKGEEHNDDEPKQTTRS